jgi:hypothetical protein
MLRPSRYDSRPHDEIGGKTKLAGSVARPGDLNNINCALW